MFGRASGKSKLLKTHDDADCMLLPCALVSRARRNFSACTHARKRSGRGKGRKNTARETTCARGICSLVPRPPRPHAERRSGDFSRFSWHSSSIWDGPIRLQDFAYHAIVTFKLTCDGYPNPAPWARHNAQFADHALVAEMRMRISMCHMI